MKNEVVCYSFKIAYLLLINNIKKTSYRYIKLFLNTYLNLIMFCGSEFYGIIVLL